MNVGLISLYPELDRGSVDTLTLKVLLLGKNQSSVLDRFAKSSEIYNLPNVGSNPVTL